MSGETITHQRIRELMGHYGLTPSGLSYQAGHDRSMLRMFFKRPNGHLNPSILERVSKVLRCTPAYLRGETDEIELFPTAQTEDVAQIRPSQILGFRVKYFRVKSGLTQQDVANAFSLSKAAVSSWESGVNSPSIDKRRTLCNLFNLQNRSLENDEIEVEVQAAMEREQSRTLPKVAKPVPSLVRFPTAAPSPPTETTEPRLAFKSVGEAVEIDIKMILPFDAAMEVIALAKKHASAVTRPAAP